MILLLSLKYLRAGSVFSQIETSILNNEGKSKNDDTLFQYSCLAAL